MTSLDALDNAVRLEACADWRNQLAREAIEAGDNVRACLNEGHARARLLRAAEHRAVFAAATALGDEHAAVPA